MSRHDQPSALRPDLTAFNCYRALIAGGSRHVLLDGTLDDVLAERACDLAAAFLRTWKRRNPDTAERRFEGQDVPEARGLAAGIGVNR